MEKDTQRKQYPYESWGDYSDCRTERCPSQIHMWKPQPSLRLFVNRAFKEEIKIKRGHKSRALIYKIGILNKRKRNREACTQRKAMGELQEGSYLQTEEKGLRRNLSLHVRA